MGTDSIKEEMDSLEIQYQNLEKSLDRAIRNNEVLAKTKKIYHELKIVGEKLDQLKKLNDPD
ncbi:MAG TPA: hypothetical protein VFI33_05390 [Puia sp.]|nr:hypothetical protein [Puia sp.]